MDKYNKVYLDILNEYSNNEIINEEYHRAPFGWSKDYFAKVIISMLKKSIKEFAYEEFDDFFLSDKLYSFKNIFKTEPKVSVSGAGKSFSVILNYEIGISPEESGNILFGKGGAEGMVIKNR